MNKVGRPTKYEDRFLDATPYLSLCGRENTKLPTIEGFALYLGVHRDTLYEWAKNNKDFSDTLKDIELVQKEQLINDGIYGGKEVNASIVKLLLENNHGMRDNDKTGDSITLIYNINNDNRLLKVDGIAGQAIGSSSNTSQT